MMKIGTSGFRGIIADDFTFDAVAKIAKATCDIIKRHRFKKEVFVGYDNRFLSDSFATLFAKVLAANDIKVVMTGGSVPCPLVSFAGRFLGNDISVFISASHNPYYYNGIKIFSKDGRDLEHYLEEEYNSLADHEKKIKNMELSQAKENGLFEIRPSLYGEYIDNMMKNVKFSQGIPP